MWPTYAQHNKESPFQRKKQNQNRKATRKQQIEKAAKCNQTQKNKQSTLQRKENLSITGNNYRQKTKKHVKVEQ